MSNSIGRNDNFLAKARKLSIFPTSIDIFDIRQHYVYVFSISPLCFFLKLYGPNFRYSVLKIPFLCSTN